MIDDAPHGIAAATELGMAAVLVDRTGYAGTGGRQDIRTLDELDPTEPMSIADSTLPS